MRCGDGATLAAAEDVGRWMLPAFMSGLREIRPQPELTADDALELASQLAAIAFDEASLAMDAYARGVDPLLASPEFEPATTQRRRGRRDDLVHRRDERGAPAGYVTPR